MSDLSLDRIKHTTFLFFFLPQDVYVLFCLMYLVVFALENAAMISMAKMLDAELVYDYDSFLSLVLVSIAVFVHIFFAVYIQLTVSIVTKLLYFLNISYPFCLAMSHHQTAIITFRTRGQPPNESQKAVIIDMMKSVGEIASKMWQVV